MLKEFQALEDSQGLYEPCHTYIGNCYEATSVVVFAFQKLHVWVYNFTITTKMCVGIILEIFVFVSSTFFFFKAHKRLEQIINQPTRRK